MKRAEFSPDLVSALIQARGAFDSVDPSGENKHLGTKYATLSDLLRAVEKPLRDAGLLLIQSPEIEPGGEGEKPLVHVETVLVHTSGASYSSTLSLPLGGKGDAQALGSTITYLSRYGLRSILAIPTDDGEDDGESIRPENAAPAKKKRASKQDLRKVADIATAFGLSKDELGDVVRRVGERDGVEVLGDLPSELVGRASIACARYGCQKATALAKGLGVDVETVQIAHGVEAPFKSTPEPEGLSGYFQDLESRITDTERDIDAAGNTTNTKPGEFDFPEDEG